MLNDADASGFKKVYLAMGFTDLRRGIDGLATIVRFQFKLDPYDKNTLFLFCGRRCDRIKALLWEGDGFLLMYKRLDNGAFRWPRSADEAMASRAGRPAKCRKSKKYQNCKTGVYQPDEKVIHKQSFLIPFVIV